jgi:NADPH:quinone reductase-like Zn-dependent oxidoreductase
LKARGVKTINIVRRDEHIAGLKAIGADVVINSEKEDLVKKVLEIAPVCRNKILFISFN